MYKEKNFDVDRCLVKDDLLACNVHQLVEHRFVKTPIYMTLSSVVKNTQDVANGKLTEKGD